MTFLAVHATKGVVSLYAPIYIPSEMSGCPWYQFTGFSRTFYKTGLSSSALCERTLLIFSLQLDFIRETTMYSWIRIKHYRVYFLKESPGNYFMIILFIFYASFLAYLEYFHEDVVSFANIYLSINTRKCAHPNYLPSHDWIEIYSLLYVYAERLYLFLYFVRGIWSRYPKYKKGSFILCKSWLCLFSIDSYCIL